MKPKFNIGDKVYVAVWDSERVWETCPECGGTKHLRVILWDETEHTIACEGCKSGYLGPIGQINHYERRPTAPLCEVMGVEIEAHNNPRTIGYSLKLEVTGYSYRVDEDRVFHNQADALKRAAVVCEEEQALERDRINRKVKDHRSWSWHVHYHRQEIRRAEKSIKYHSDALNVAKTKSKEPEDKAIMTATDKATQALARG